MRIVAGASLLLVAVVAACSAGPRLVPLVRAGGAPIGSLPSSAAPLEVVSRSTAVPDPLVVRGSGIAYADLGTALGIAVSTATSPWASNHRDHPVAQKGGWTVMVEVTGAEASVEAEGRVVVGLDVRATLRARSGNVYLGQTQLGCREGGLVSAEQGAPVVYRCLTRVARDLAGWLEGGVSLDPPAEP